MTLFCPLPQQSIHYVPISWEMAKMYIYIYIYIHLKKSGTIKKLTMHFLQILSLFE